MARGLPDGPVPPNTYIFDSDVDFRCRCRFSISISMLIFAARRLAGALLLGLLRLGLDGLPEHVELRVERL
eukprot:468034-Heterocapsa_arctica.AAC.1